MSYQNMMNEINDLINKMCQNVVGGELTQLGALFTPCFLDELSEIIYKNERLKHPRLIIDVTSHLCWIDKAPYAKLCSGTPFNKKVELGDAMFIFDEKFVDTRSQRVLSERNKAFILQAKITDKETHVCHVPVTKYNASKKIAPIKNLSFIANGQILIYPIHPIQKKLKRVILT